MNTYISIVNSATGFSRRLTLLRQYFPLGQLGAPLWKWQPLAAYENQWMYVNLACRDDCLLCKCQIVYVCGCFKMPVCQKRKLSLYASQQSWLERLKMPSFTSKFFFCSLWFGSTMDSFLFTFILYKGKYFRKEFSIS